MEYDELCNDNADQQSHVFSEVHDVVETITCTAHMHTQHK